MSSRKEISEGEVKDRLVLAVREAGSAKAYALSQGFSPQYISAVCSGRSAPAPRLLAALGVRREVRLVNVEA